MKLVIFGSRSFRNYQLLNKILTSTSSFKQGEISAVISGTAKGADLLGELWAKNNRIPIIRMPADWDKYGKSAGHKRNKEMAILADKAIGFWDGESPGTQGMIDLCGDEGIPLLFVNQKINKLVKCIPGERSEIIDISEIF